MALLRLLPRFRDAYRVIDALAAREEWSRGEIETWQLERLNAIWAHARVHVPYYRAVADRLPPRFASLAEYSAAIPPLLRARLKDRPEVLLSDRPAPGEWHTSSGSTGTPTRFYWEQDAHLLALRCRYRMQASWGVDVFDRTALLWGNGAQHETGWYGPVARARRAVEDWLRNRLRLSAYHLAPADLRGHLRRLAAFRPALLYAYSTAALLLAREAEQAGLRPQGLKVCVLSAEPAPPHLTAAVERGLGAPAAVEYGATECPLIAGEGPDRVLRVREDLVFVETRPTGEGRHELLLSVLTNASFPLLRYAIGDLTDAPLEVPPRGFAVMRNVAGRENDLIVTGAGRLLHPLRFDFVFGFWLPEDVRRYHVHQHGDGTVDVMVELCRPITPAEQGRLQRELDDLLEGHRVTILLVPAITPADRKHRWTTSDLTRSPASPAAAPGAVVNA